MSDVGRMRYAAGILQRHAHEATSGPWEAYQRRDHGWGVGRINHPEAVTEETYFGADDARYIATVDPEIGIELAALLNNIADRADQITDAMPPSESTAQTVRSSNVPGWDHAVRITELILRGRNR